MTTASLMPATIRAVASKPCAATDLDLLGRWLPAIEGTAVPLPTGDQIDANTLVDAGRPDKVDEHSRDIALAARTLRMLDALAAQNPMHVLVLFYAFVLCGSGTRAHYNGAKITVGDDGVADNDETEAKGSAGFERRVGMLFAEPVTLAAWFDGSPSETKIRAAAYGRGLLADAVGAYERLPPDARLADHDRRRCDLPKLRAILSRLERSFEERLAAHTRTRAGRSRGRA